MRRLSSGRDSFEPEMPRSTYSLKTSQPRRDTYSRSSASCISGLCPWHVETLAYRATRMSIPPKVAGGQLSLSILRNSAEISGRRELISDTDPILAIFRTDLVFSKVMALLKVPLLDWPENRFYWREILGLGCGCGIGR